MVLLLQRLKSGAAEEPHSTSDEANEQRRTRNLVPEIPGWLRSVLVVSDDRLIADVGAWHSPRRFRQRSGQGLSGRSIKRPVDRIATEAVERLLQRSRATRCQPALEVRIVVFRRYRPKDVEEVPIICCLEIGPNDLTHDGPRIVRDGCYRRGTSTIRRRCATDVDSPLRNGCEAAPLPRRLCHGQEAPYW
jgi:hypothetical protein